jgi:hypothetical protein
MKDLVVTGILGLIMLLNMADVVTDISLGVPAKIEQLENSRMGLSCLGFGTGAASWARALELTGLPNVENPCGTISQT